MFVFTRDNVGHELHGLIKALVNVDNGYLSYSTNELLVFTKKRIDKDVLEQVERVFAYELYHQWSSTKPKNLVLNGEIGKKMNDKYKFPDLALHGGQKDFIHNEVIVEIKRLAAKSGTLNDLRKLTEYLRDSDEKSHFHKYNNAVFIPYGGDMDDIRVTEKWKDLNPNIIMLFYKGNNVAKYITLGEFLERQRKLRN